VTSPAARAALFCRCKTMTPSPPAWAERAAFLNAVAQVGAPGSRGREPTTSEPLHSSWAPLQLILVL